MFFENYWRDRHGIFACPILWFIWTLGIVEIEKFLSIGQRHGLRCCDQRVILELVHRPWIMEQMLQHLTAPMVISLGLLIFIHVCKSHIQ